jgi:hypothetical protein
MSRRVKRERVERRDIKAVRTATLHIELSPDRKQFFCETGAAYEIWDEMDLLHRVKRIPKSRVLMVFPKEGER